MDGRYQKVCPQNFTKLQINNIVTICSGKESDAKKYKDEEKEARRAREGKPTAMTNVITCAREKTLRCSSRPAVKRQALEHERNGSGGRLKTFKALRFYMYVSLAPQHNTTQHSRFFSLHAKPPAGQNTRCGNTQAEMKRFVAVCVTRTKQRRMAW
jgi:hypothetical protein